MKEFAVVPRNLVACRLPPQLKMSKITNKPRVEFRIESYHPRGLDSSQKPQELEKFIHRIIVLKVDFDAKLPYFGQHARLDDIWQDFPF